MPSPSTPRVSRRPARAAVLVALLAAAAATAADFAGDDACVACHRDQVLAYHRTAHALTSSRPSAGTIKGNFTPGANLLRTANPNLLFVMEAAGDDFTQTAAVRTKANEGFTRVEHFAVVVGSGRKGQTYLFWDGDQLFQLPVSYWTELGTWINSPGYVDGTANFERPVSPRCLECHASSFVARGATENSYVKSSLVVGITCEKCHGPGSEHVARYRSATPPASPAGSAIVNPARLARDRQIDVCTLCHAGPGNALTPPLSFKPGDVLADHLAFAPEAADAPLDVHASQVQMLERSRCFRESAAMTCSTCHNVHRPERDVAAFAARCLACHQVEACRQFPHLGAAIASQCVTCHMPLQKTNQIIVSGLIGKSVQPQVRSHRIAIYPDVTLP